MKRIDSLPFGARGCAVLGNVTRDPEGFIAVPSPPPVNQKRLFISAQAVKIMAHEFGMVTKEDALEFRFRIQELEKQLELAEDEAAEATLVLESFDALGKKGITAKRVGGRPKKQPQEAT